MVERAAPARRLIRTRLPKTVSSMARRPAGFVILAVLTGWLAFAGFANAVVMLTLGRPAGYGTVPLGLLALAYGVTAAAACAGFLRAARWALTAYLAWVAAVLVMGLYLSLTRAWLGDFPPPPPPSWLRVLFLGLTTGLLLLPVPYIRRRLAAIHGRRSAS